MKGGGGLAMVIAEYDTLEKFNCFILPVKLVQFLHLKDGPAQDSQTISLYCFVLSLSPHGIHVQLIFRLGASRKDDSTAAASACATGI